MLAFDISGNTVRRIANWLQDRNLKIRWQGATSEGARSFLPWCSVRKHALPAVNEPHL